MNKVLMNIYIYKVMAGYIKYNKCYIIILVSCHSVYSILYDCNRAIIIYLHILCCQQSHYYLFTYFMLPTKPLSFIYIFYVAYANAYITRKLNILRLYF